MSVTRSYESGPCSLSRHVEQRLLLALHTRWRDGYRSAKAQGYYSYDPGDYHSVGENIGLGGDFTDQDTPERRFTGWMHSPGHRANILRGEFEEVGVGARSGTYQEYDDTSTIYTTVFGGR